LSIKDKTGFGTESGGSPLYESPESLQVRLRTATAEVYSERSDVWSYSIVVWEIFKQRLIYSDEHGNLPFSSAQQYYDFLESGGLPPVDGIPDAIANVLKQCWKFRSDERPTFQELLPLIRQARVSAFLPKKDYPDYHNLWSTKFLEAGKVSIPSFLEALGSTDPDEHERLLKILVWGNEEKGEGHNISLPKFKKLICWFGTAGVATLLPTFENLVKNEYFYGVIASNALGNHLTKPGQFLVRINEGNTKGIDQVPFYIARIDQKGKLQLTPVSPSKKNVGHFFCTVPSAEVDKKTRSKDKPETQISGARPGLPALIEAIQTQAKKVLTKPIQFSPFHPEPVCSEVLYGAQIGVEI